MTEYVFTFHGQQSLAPKLHFKGSVLTDFDFLGGNMALQPNPEFDADVLQIIVRKALGETSGEIYHAMGFSYSDAVTIKQREVRKKFGVNEDTGFMLACLSRELMVRTERGLTSRFDPTDNQALILDELALGTSRADIEDKFSISRREFNTRIGAIANRSHIGTGVTRLRVLVAAHLMTRGSVKFD
jgi:hypothetical protein